MLPSARNPPNPGPMCLATCYKKYCNAPNNPMMLKGSRRLLGTLPAGKVGNGPAARSCPGPVHPRVGGWVWDKTRPSPFLQTAGAVLGFLIRGLILSDSMGLLYE